MKIAIGSDHAGYELKEEILHLLASQQIEFLDFGAFSTESVDYPDYGIKVAEAVAAGEFDLGILVCGSGIGMSIVANKVPGIRAALCIDAYCARFSREHNNANILVLGGRVVSKDTALDIVKTWLSTDYPGEQRHARRIEKISEIEKRFNRGGA
jgi:ribose 5-phosphate isomerase B